MPILERAAAYDEQGTRLTCRLQNAVPRLGETLRPKLILATRFQAKRLSKLPRKEAGHPDYCPASQKGEHEVDDSDPHQGELIASERAKIA